MQMQKHLGMQLFNLAPLMSSGAVDTEEAVAKSQDKEGLGTLLKMSQARQEAASRTAVG